MAAGNCAKLWLHVACISAPTAAVVALAARFLVCEVPDMAEGERKRVAAETENAALALRSDPASADFVWERGKGIVAGDASFAAEFPASLSWKEWRPEGAGKSKDMWGWRPRGAVRLVWTRGVGADAAGGDASKFVYAKEIGVAERGWARALTVAVPAALLVLVGVTAFGVRYFVGYVKSRDDFMAATAHDLTTPLVAMRYMIGRDDAEASRLNERMLRLVGNVKDFMRLGGRRAAPKREPFDLLAAYDEAYALFREDYRDLFDGEDVEATVGGAARTPDARLVATGDETLAVQILWNLLGNDLKYAAPHGRVRVAFSAEGGFARAEFADEGPGMARRDMRRAFDRYYRAKTVLESGKGGFGIGLCTAREFAEAMGGSLTVRANAPRGCVFTLSLPLAEA